MFSIAFSSRRVTGSLVQQLCAVFLDKIVINYRNLTKGTVDRYPSVREKLITFSSPGTTAPDRHDFSNIFLYFLDAKVTLHY